MSDFFKKKDDTPKKEKKKDRKKKKIRVENNLTIYQMFNIIPPKVVVEEVKVKKKKKDQFIIQNEEVIDYNQIERSRIIAEQIEAELRLENQQLASNEFVQQLIKSTENENISNNYNIIKKDENNIIQYEEFELLDEELKELDNEEPQLINEFKSNFNLNIKSITQRINNRKRPFEKRPIVEEDINDNRKIGSLSDYPIRRTTRFNNFNNYQNNINIINKFVVDENINNSKEKEDDIIEYDTIEYDTIDYDSDNTEDFGLDYDSDEITVPIKYQNTIEIEYNKNKNIQEELNQEELNELNKEELNELNEINEPNQLNTLNNLNLENVSTISDTQQQIIKNIDSLLRPDFNQVLKNYSTKYKISIKDLIKDKNFKNAINNIIYIYQKKGDNFFSINFKETSSQYNFINIIAKIFKNIYDITQEWINYYDKNIPFSNDIYTNDGFIGIYIDMFMFLIFFILYKLDSVIDIKIAKFFSFIKIKFDEKFNYKRSKTLKNIFNIRNDTILNIYTPKSREPVRNSEKNIITKTINFFEQSVFDKLIANKDIIKNENIRDENLETQFNELLNVDISDSFLNNLFD